MKIHKATFRCSPSQTAFVLEQIFYGGQLILAFVGVNAVRHRHQPDVMLREKFFGQPSNLNVIPPQARKVLHEHGCGLALLNLLEHGDKAGTVHRDAGNPVVIEMDKVGITFFLGDLGEQLLLRSDLSRVNSPLRAISPLSMVLFAQAVMYVILKFCGFRQKPY